MNDDDEPGSGREPDGRGDVSRASAEMQEREAFLCLKGRWLGHTDVP